MVGVWRLRLGFLKYNTSTVDVDVVCFNNPLVAVVVAGGGPVVVGGVLLLGLCGFFLRRVVGMLLAGLHGWWSLVVAVVGRAPLRPTSERRRKPSKRARQRSKAAKTS